MRASAIVLLLVACGGEKAERKAPPPVKPAIDASIVFVEPPPDMPPLPPPSKDKPTQSVIDAMRDLCAIGGKNPPETKLAMKAWLDEHAGNEELAVIYLRAITEGDESSIAQVRAAAGAAVGGESCDFVDFLLRAGQRARAAAGAARP